MFTTIQYKKNSSYVTIKIVTGIMSLFLTHTTLQAFSLGDIANSVTNAVTPTPKEDNSYVKDMQDGPILSDKPYIRGLSKVSFSEIHRLQEGDEKNDNLIGLRATDGRNALYIAMQNDRTRKPFVQDAIHDNVFDKTNIHTVYSNPKVSSYVNYDLEQLSKYLKVINEDSIYRFQLDTHVKIPDDMIKDGTVMFEAKSLPLTYSLAPNGEAKACFQMVNNKFVEGNEYLVKVKEGNTIDLSMTCYFASDETFQLYQLRYDTPNIWTVKSSMDPITGEFEKTYKLTKFDMFLYKDDVYKK